MANTLQEFLDNKGAIGLLSLLHERPKAFSDIEPEIGVTSDTITARRDEAADLGLVNISHVDTDDRKYKMNHLTDMGEFLTNKMAREGLFNNYRRMRELEELVDEQTNELVAWVGENSSQLLQFEEADGTIIRDQTQIDQSPTGKSGPNSDKTQDNASKASEDDTGDAPPEPTDNRSENSSSGRNPTEPTEDEKEDAESPPSESVRFELDELDQSNTDQGTLSDMDFTDSTEDESE